MGIWACTKFEGLLDDNPNYKHHLLLVYDLNP